MPTDPRLLEFARQMRWEPTPTEELVWRALRNRQLSGVKFRRQRPLGRYILDIYAASCALVIELDGDSHATDEGREHDRVRHEYLQELGLKVIRFWNAEVHDDLDAVVEAIFLECVRQQKVLDGARNWSGQPRG
ncbi:MAG TPA: endonuclease domain-containing protein [Gemmataceae bacterium]|nr:endonuclease domain-containing protein [Gemmataceae bacterium]